MIRRRLPTELLILLLIPAALPAQTAGPDRSTAAPPQPAATGARPRPYPIFETPAFARAVAAGTRTRTGAPGPKYWRQYASYRIEAALDPAARRVRGREVLHYVNASPDTLREIAIYLRQNIYSPGVPRNATLPITGGVRLERVAAGEPGDSLASADAGRTLTSATGDGPGYLVDGTILHVRPPAPVPPRGTIDLAFVWSYTPPPAPADGREGEEGGVFFLGYWYPQAAVYDDVNGWVTDPYLGRAEFYMGYADYDVALTVPNGWLVAATGTLENAAEVLPPPVRARLEEAHRSGDVVHVVTAADHAAGTATTAGSAGTLTWRFSARDVRDFAWATSNRYLWDATRALVGERPRPDTVAIYAFYRATPQAAAWVDGARYNRDAIEFLSGYLWPYPWPQMTAVEGVLSGGGMEYPMLTVIQSYADSLRLAGNLMHEDGHMWFPMQVGSNETRHTWMDEGLTQFNSAQGVKATKRGEREGPARQAYLGVVRSGREVPLMTWGDLFPDGGLYSTESYQKTTTVLVALRALLGDSTFLRAYREYGRRWVGKHPEPYDFFNTVEDVAKRPLDWFWRAWWFEAWPLDQALASVATTGDSTAIVVEDRGLAPMPVRLVVTRADGSAQRLEVPVDLWLAGARRHTVRVAARPEVVRVEIDPEGAFPDMDPANQRWSR